MEQRETLGNGRARQYHAQSHVCTLKGTHQIHGRFSACTKREAISVSTLEINFFFFTVRLVLSAKHVNDSKLSFFLGSSSFCMQVLGSY